VKHSIVYLFFLSGSFLFNADCLFAGPKFEPITGFNLERFLGKWYEIARFPHSFERGLVNVTATYTIRPDGKIDILNEGYKNTPGGKHKKAHGKAKPGSTADTGYLRVSFFGPFYADYIIIDLDKENYSYVMVTSSYKYLWILSREPKLPEEVIIRLVDKAKSLGFDISKLYFVPQKW